MTLDTLSCFTTALTGTQYVKMLIFPHRSRRPLSPLSIIAVKYLFVWLVALTSNHTKKYLVLSLVPSLLCLFICQQNKLTTMSANARWRQDGAPTPACFLLYWIYLQGGTPPPTSTPNPDSSAEYHFYFLFKLEHCLQTHNCSLAPACVCVCVCGWCVCVCFSLSFNGLAGCASFLRVVEPRLNVIRVVICAPVFLHVLGSSLMIRERNAPLSERRSDVTGACTRVLFFNCRTAACSSAGHCCVRRLRRQSIFDSDESKAQLCPGLPVFLFFSFTCEMSKRVRVLFEELLPGKGGKRSENLITPHLFI